MMMTPAQVGGYIRALCYQWESGGFPVGLHEQKIITGCNEDDISVIARKFVRKGTVLANSKLEEVRLDREHYIEIQRINGKKGGRPKGKAMENPSLSQPQTQTKAKKSLPSPSPSPSPLPVDDAAWLAALRTQPAYAGLDFDHELREAKQWIQKHPTRRFTRRFFENWLKRADKPLNLEIKELPPSQRY
jgi:hypothetical protein